MYIYLLFIFFVPSSLASWAQWPLKLFNNDDPYPKRPGSRMPVPALYHARYSEQTFIGTHDAAALRTPENGYSISGNQYFNVSIQLQSGVGEASLPYPGAKTECNYRSVSSKPKVIEIRRATALLTSDYVTSTVH
jgi:hypothetical protein